MLKFPKMLPNKVYRIRNQYTLPYNEKDQLKGNLIAVFGENINDTAEFFKSPYWQFRRYNRYFIERKVVTSIAGLPIREKNNQQEIFINGFGMSYPETRLVVTPAACRNLNVIYELNQYTNMLLSSNKINNKSVLQQKEIRMTEFTNRLASISTEFSNYKKYLIIPVEKYIENPRSSSIWSKREFLYVFLMQLIRQILDNPSQFSKLKDWTFIFSNVNEVFFIECKDINSGTFELIRNNFKKFRSRRNAVDLSETDDDLLGDTEDSNEENIPSVNEKNTLAAATDVVKTVNSLPISEEKKTNIKKQAVSEIKKMYTDNSKNPITLSNDDIKEKAKTDSLKSKKLLSDEIEDNDKVPENSIKSSSNKLIPKEDLVDAGNKEVKKEINKLILPDQKMSVQRLARIEKIQKEMKDIKIDDTPIKDLAVKAKKKRLENHEIKADVMNKNIKNIPFDNFEKGYNENLLEYDLVNILTSFAEKDRPLILISLKKEDTSTEIDKLITYHATFEDERGTRHTLTFDMPKFVDEKFIYINGSPKLFINQIIPLPITKVSPDEVQVSSNYNKVFIRRFGKNVSGKISKFHKSIPELPSKIITYTKGNNVQENAPYMTTIEYDELGSKYSTINLMEDNITIYFNQKEIMMICNTQELTYDSETEIPFAIESTKDGELKLITLDINKDTISGTELSPIDFIIEKISNYIPSFKKDFSKLSVGKKYMYTRATIMAKKVPMVLLLAFLNGLEPLLNRMNVEWKFTEKRPQLKGSESNDYSIITFKDGYFIYKNAPFSNALLLNGLYDIPTEEYDFLEFSSKDIYYDLFIKLFGRRNIGNAFENFQQLFIDPITKEVLSDYNLPTNFTDLMIYANSLLENNTFDLDGDLKNYRIRSNEMVNAHLYKVLSKAYENYRVTADNRNPTKMSIKRNEVINDIFNSQVLEEYSTLNPIFEIDRMRSTSYKGPGGCNVDRAFNIEKRAYNPSMLGVLAQSSPISSSIGISRIMSLNPNITSLRGYIDAGSKEEIDKLDMTSMLSGAEMLVPMSATHDDAQRVSMASTQSRHTISTMDSDAPLFGYGTDKILAKIISNRFAYKAKEDGVIIEINDKLGYMIVEYKSGKRDVIDISNKQALNTGSGFYINNKLSPTHTEIGKKFKAGDVIALNKDFFRYDPISGDVVYTSGPLVRVAVLHGSCVFEDSTIVTEELAERLSSYVTEKKDICIGKNSNIYHIAKIGDIVKVGDPLLLFDESYEDEYLNKLLARMKEDEKEDIINAGKTPIKSKFNGKIIDVKIYYTVPKNELSETLQKIITDYEKPIKTRLKNFNENNIEIKDLISLNELPQHTTPINGKIKGVKMNDNEVLIEFYIQTVDKFAPGDKITYSTALKGINQALIPKGKEPYLASDPNEKIHAMMGVTGFYSRMTNSFALALALNTTLLGAEKKIADILKM